MMASFTPSSSSTTSVANGSSTGCSALLNLCIGHETSLNLNVLPLLGTFWQCNPGYSQEQACKLNSQNNLQPNLPPIARPINQMHFSGADNNIYSTPSFQNTIGAALTNGLNRIADKQFNYGIPNPLSTSDCIPKREIKRQVMHYHCLFRIYGMKSTKCIKPCSIAVNARNDIILVDANNHRVLIFDICGRYQFQLRGCNTISGNFSPYRVAVDKTTGNIIVLERSPAFLTRSPDYQIQIYNQYGVFLGNVGNNIMENPRAVSVDNKGRIIVVESRVKRVRIFHQNGKVLKQFYCSKHCDFPVGITVNDKHEIFICDNRAHCVNVFNYEGAFLRRIGEKGITNYPIAVEINSAGEILVADNHHDFNLTIFTQEGHLVSALKGIIKYKTLNDMTLTKGGLVLLASNEHGLCFYIPTSSG